MVVGVTGARHRRLGSIRLAVLAGALCAGTAPAQAAEFQGSIGSALEWIAGALSGSLATAIAVLAIAAVGMRWLGGVADWRAAARAVIGVSLIFSANTIAANIIRAPDQAPPITAHAAHPETILPPQSNSMPIDPYAGAAYFPSSNDKAK